MSAPARTFGYAVEDRVYVITLHGHVDVAGIDALKRRVRDVPPGVHHVVLDLSAVTRMSTHALSALIAGLRALNRERSRIAGVVCEHGAATRDLELADLPDVQVFATLRSALADAP